MVHKIISFVCFLLVALMAQAQDSNNLQVMSVQGNVRCDANKLLKIGSELSENQIITISNHSKITLINKDGEIWNLNKTGEYSIKSLMHGKQTPTLLPKKYRHLLSDAMFEETSSKKKSVNRAVRADLDQAFGVLLPMSVEILEPQLTIKLFDTRTDTTLHINWNIKAMTVGEELLFEQNTNQPKTVLDLEQYFEENDNIILHIIALDKNGNRMNSSASGDENMIIKMDIDDAERLQYDLQQVIKTIGDIELQLLVKARFYEEYNLIADAITAYETLLEIVPEAKIYKRAYDAFLFRHGLNL